MNTNRGHFGPWTTSLHHANQLELSAFWKQRLHRLRSLPNLPTRLGTRKTLAFTGIAVALLLVPRVELQRVAAAADAKLSGESLDLAAARLDSTDAPAPFTATFSNGVQVELIGLGENPSKDKPWWRPDGSPLAERPLQRVPAHMGGGFGSIGREVCWRWKNTPDDPDFDTGWSTVPHYGGAGGGTAFDAEGKKVPDLVAWAIQMPKSPGTCTFKFSVTVDYTPWKTVFSDDGKHESSMSRSDLGVRLGASFNPARVEGDATVISVSYQIPDQAVRLVAIDEDGKVHQAGSSSGGGALGFNMMTYQFRNLPLEKIKRFELQAQTRRFETIEFRNVSLDPAKRTQVEIVHPDFETKLDSKSESSTVAMPKIAAGDIVLIRVLGAMPDAPIDDLFRVEPSGKVPLGPQYGRVAIAGLTFEEAETALTRHLAERLQNPVVQVTDGQWELERRGMRPMTNR